MTHRLFQGLSEKHFKVSSFLFSSLLLLSVAFFVFADDETNGKNIFQDSDQDGLSNDEEKLYGTDPLERDTDGDSYSDGVEVEGGYDPLKPAPGDKIVSDSDDADGIEDVDISLGVGGDNLTEQVSQEIASVLKNSDGAESVSADQLNESIQKVLNGSLEEEIVLPEVNMDEIKIKKLPKNLKESEREKRQKEDALEYLTTLAYLMANNSPQSFSNQDELGEMLGGISEESLSALLSGNMQYLDQLSERGEKILKEINTIEVPEDMVEIHLKAIKMAKYAIQLKTEIKPSTDPIGQIATISKIQGFLNTVLVLSGEIYQKVEEYGIEEIPLEL